MSEYKIEISTNTGEIFNEFFLSYSELEDLKEDLYGHDHYLNHKEKTILLLEGVIEKFG